MNTPTIAEVTNALLAVNTVVDAECDVRLQVYDNGKWALRYGLSDYDQDHRGYWGASCVPGKGEPFNAQAIAADLIAQVNEVLP